MKILQQINNPSLVVKHDGSEELPAQFMFPEKKGGHFWVLRIQTIDRGVAIYERKESS